MTQEIAFIGISPGNGYFKANRLAKLFEATVAEHGRAVVSIMDWPSVFNQLALGKTLKESQKKAKQQTRYLMGQVNLGRDQVAPKTQLSIDILSWQKQIHAHPAYLAERHKMTELYTTSATFRESVNAAAREVISHQAKAGQVIGTKEVAIASHYVIDEFALLDSAARILSVDKVHYYYHRPWPVYEDLLGGKFDRKQRPEQNFHILNFA